jgi:hypothetical protein
MGDMSKLLDSVANIGETAGHDCKFGLGATMRVLLRALQAFGLLALGLASSAFVPPPPPAPVPPMPIVRSSPTQKAYYGRDFYTEVAKGSRNNQLKGLLHLILTSEHQQVADDYDLVPTPPCGSKPGCYRHSSIGYDRARVFLLGYFYLSQTANGYGVREVYCSRIYDAPEFANIKPAPGRICEDKVVNVEHTWPQSRFNHRLPEDVQKADLHHLFPADSQVNAIRGNNEFGMVTRATQRLDCEASKFGIGEFGGSEVFEPPANHRGNVARALFYFSTRYELPISSNEEATLKRWNHEDPVDQEEMRRNEEIFKVQGDRNPFVDYPDLADRISDF